MKTLFLTGQTINDVLDDPLDNYPASAGWTMRIVLNPSAGGALITLDAVASGDDYLLQVPYTTTEGWAPGMYGWEIWAINGGERYFTGNSGQVEIRAGLIHASTGLDTRSDARKALDAAIAARAAWTPTTRSYSINGRSMTFNSPAEIMEYISHLEAEVRREELAADLAAGRPNKRKVYVRMGRA